jgi:Domain of unknown function (DUF1707)
MTAELPPALPSPSHDVTPQLRASHADRDLAVDILCVAAGDGRLSTAELDERLETALTAHTISELAALTADLPGGTMLQAACQAWAGENLPDVAVHIEVWLEFGPGPALVTGQPAVADTDQRTASRWTLLQSLLNKPRRYELLAGVTRHSP